MLRSRRPYISFPPMRRICLLLLALMTAAAQAQVTLTARPLSREQVTAFYSARGFPAASMAAYAQTCVLSFEFHNGGPTALHFRLADWQTGDGARVQPASAWEAAWEKAAIPEAARIAFRWSQFPAEQEFAAGDWIMGMAALDRRPPGSFHLIARYHDHQGHHDIVLDRISCADD